MAMAWLCECKWPALPIRPNTPAGLGCLGRGKGLCCFDLFGLTWWGRDCSRGEGEGELTLSGPDFDIPAIGQLAKEKFLRQWFFDLILY